MGLQQGYRAESYILCLVPDARDYRFLAKTLNFGHLRFFKFLPEVINKPSPKILHCNQNWYGNSIKEGLLSRHLYIISNI